MVPRLSSAPLAVAPHRRGEQAVLVRPGRVAHRVACPTRRSNGRVTQATVDRECRTDPAGPGCPTAIAGA
jgi:hypothetical protein